MRVTADSEGVPLDGSSDLGRPHLVEVQHGDGGAVRPEGTGDLPADPRGAPSDEATFPSRRSSNRLSSFIALPPSVWGGRHSAPPTCPRRGGEARRAHLGTPTGTGDAPARGRLWLHCANGSSVIRASGATIVHTSRSVGAPERPLVKTAVPYRTDASVAARQRSSSSCAPWSPTTPCSRTALRPGAARPGPGDRHRGAPAGPGRAGRFASARRASLTASSPAPPGLGPAGAISQ